ncbi:Histidine--tRNA ligase [uncultured Desulfatiglans sp.]|uniref:Histidine--tRNA ligase n=1 Tax=Uncultured Desulfatiglans sp. TaxID=1748965 RepID=A0A653A213_UNCDX|nr:Histidine--tRNA ligase [uncultured Desulfatiglans sp.]
MCATCALKPPAEAEPLFETGRPILTPCEMGDFPLEFATIKGFKDILPEEIPYWQETEAVARRTFQASGFQEIRTPLIEATELFARSIGEETDIVSKEMYSFEDSKGRGLSLRPEATASVVRAYIQNRLYQQDPVQKLFTIGPMFRHERPQKGRFRQFHQINAEFFGDPGPKSDAEIIVLAESLFHALGLRDLTLLVNSLGCPTCRPDFRAELQIYLQDREDRLCTDCRRRSHTNPLRVLDCKVPGCRETVADAPLILDVLCDDCRRHLEGLQEYLDLSGVVYTRAPRLVRGLDYYTRTTFEFQTERLGAQNAVAGGGRYDGLVRQLGGPDLPAIGFAVGAERLIALLQELRPCPAGKPDLFLAALGEAAEKTCFGWATALRRAGLWAETGYGLKGLKAQMKKADKLGVSTALILGENELAEGQAILRDMQSGRQETIGTRDIVPLLVKRLTENPAYRA